MCNRTRRTLQTTSDRSVHQSHGSPQHHISKSQPAAVHGLGRSHSDVLLNSCFISYIPPPPSALRKLIAKY